MRRLVSIAAAALLAVFAVAADDGADKQEGRAIAGKWEIVHGPKELYVSHFYDLNNRAPPSSITFRYTPDDAADKDFISWHHNLKNDLGVIPGSCYEIDPVTKAPTTAEAGRDRAGGFERVKDRLMGLTTVYSRDDLITLRFGRLTNETLPLIVPANGVMEIRCGPILQRIEDGSSDGARRDPMDPALVADGKIPAGFASYMYTGNTPGEPFFTFRILSTAPAHTLLHELDHGPAPMSAIKNLYAKKNAPRAVDLSERDLRLKGFHLRLSIGYDTWKDADELLKSEGGDTSTTSTAADALKEKIAASIRCAPIPCHKRLRSRQRFFRSVEHFKDVVGEAALSGDEQALDKALLKYFGEDASLTDLADGLSVFRASDVTLSHSSAVVSLTPDTLLRRGFDILPEQEPPESNVDHEGKETDVAETFYELELRAPEESTVRWAELLPQINHPGTRASHTFTMSAHKFAPPVIRLSEYDVGTGYFRGTSRVVITENCLTGANTTKECLENRLIATLRFSRPGNTFVGHARPPEELVEYAFVEQRIAPGDQQQVSEFHQCRRRHFGWSPTIRDRVFNMHGYMVEEAENVADIRLHQLQSGAAAFDLDAAVELSLDLHPEMIRSRQPLQQPEPLTVSIVPSPAEASIVVSGAGDEAAGKIALQADAASVVLPPSLTIDVTLSGDVLTPEAVHGMEEDAGHPSTKALLGAIISFRRAGSNAPLVPLSSVSGVHAAAMQVTVDTDSTCGGGRRVNMGQLTLKAEGGLKAAIAAHDELRGAAAVDVVVGRSHGVAVAVDQPVFASGIAALTVADVGEGATAVLATLQLADGDEVARSTGGDEL